MSARRADQRFFKMTGSGNDFVVFDLSQDGAKKLEDPETIR
jgi:diaminopimelate epimerase